MQNFEFVSPTKLYFGDNAETNLCAALENYKRALIVYGQNSIKRNGVYDKVMEQLKKANVETFELSGIRANPSIQKVLEGVDIVKKNNVDIVIAIGGGSVIDTAKSICVGCFYDGNPFDFNLHKVAPKKALPLGVVLTIAASGSELSDSCVVMDDETKIKQGFNNDIVRPKFAIMNPTFTYSVDNYQTGCGIVDIISHSLERYFSKGEDSIVSESLALSVIKETIRSGKIAIDNPTDYAARSDLMLLGSLSHNGLTSLGKTKQMPIHKMEHALSAYDIRIAHGAGLSVLIPLWMSAAYKNDLQKFARFAKEVFGINGPNNEKAALSGINALKQFFVGIGMPVTLKEIYLEETDIEKVVDLMTDNGKIIVGPNSIKPLCKQEIVELLCTIL